MEHLGSLALFAVFSFAFVQSMKAVAASKRCIEEKRRIECEMAPRFIHISTEMYREKRKPLHYINLSKMQSLTEELDATVEVYHQKLEEAQPAAENSNVHTLRLV